MKYSHRQGIYSNCLLQYDILHVISLLHLQGRTSFSHHSIIKKKLVMCVQYNVSQVRIENENKNMVLFVFHVVFC